MALVCLQTGIKNRVQAILHRLGVLHSFSDLFGQGGRALLSDLELPQASGAVLQGYLRWLDDLAEEIQQVEHWMRRTLPQDEVVRWLKAIPGIGLIRAYVIRAEIGQSQAGPSARGPQATLGSHPCVALSSA
jgi:transposase